MKGKTVSERDAMAADWARRHGVDFVMRKSSGKDKNKLKRGRKKLQKKALDAAMGPLARCHAIIREETDREQKKYMELARQEFQGAANARMLKVQENKRAPISLWMKDAITAKANAQRNKDATLKSHFIRQSTQNKLQELLQKELQKLLTEQMVKNEGKPLTPEVINKLTADFNAGVQAENVELQKRLVYDRRPRAKMRSKGRPIVSTTRSHWTASTGKGSLSHGSYVRPGTFEPTSKQVGPVSLRQSMLTSNGQPINLPLHIPEKADNYHLTSEYKKHFEAYVR
jgi:hypothetical protein